MWGKKVTKRQELAISQHALSIDFFFLILLLYLLTPLGARELNLVPSCSYHNPSSADLAFDWFVFETDSHLVSQAGFDLAPCWQPLHFVSCYDNLEDVLSPEMGQL